MLSLFFLLMLFSNYIYIVYFCMYQKYKKYTLFMYTVYTYLWKKKMLVALLCPTLCDPMDCSMPGLPVHNQLPEFNQTHVHWVGDAIQPSHPLSSPFPPTSIFPSIRGFSDESVLHIRWPKYWSFSFSISPSNEYSGLISFRIDGWIFLQSKGLSRVFFNTTVKKHRFFSTQLCL